MKPSERDELLGRLDERTDNTLKLVERQEKHMSQINDKVSKNQINIDRNHNRLTDVESHLSGGLSIKFSKKQKASGGVGIASLVALVLTALGKVLGWW